MTRFLEGLVDGLVQLRVYVHITTCKKQMVNVGITVSHIRSLAELALQ